MDPSTVIKAFELGGPYAVAAIFAIAWAFERKESKQKSDKLMDLATEQVKAMTVLESTVSSLEKVMTETLRRL